MSYKFNNMRARNRESKYIYINKINRISKIIKN